MHRVLRFLLMFSCSLGTLQALAQTPQTNHRATSPSAATFPSVNGICIVDGVIHTSIASCISSLPSDVVADTRKIYTYGTVYLPSRAAAYSIASTVTIGPFVKIIGATMVPTVLNCTTTPCVKFSNSPFTVVNGDGGLYNVALQGNGASNQIGLQADDGTGMCLQNVRFYGFTGTGAVATNLSNVNYWTERLNFQHIVWDHNTTGLVLNGGGTLNTASFGHNTFLDLEFNINAGQTAWKLTSNASLSSGIATGVVNADNSRGTSTVFALTGTSQLAEGFFLQLPIDQGGGDGTGTVIGAATDSGTIFTPSGNFQGYTAAATFSAMKGITMSDMPIGPALSIGIDGASHGIGVWLTPSRGPGNGFFNAIGGNLYQGLDNNWHTNTDGANNGGWMFANTYSGINPPHLFVIPSTGNSLQTIGQSTLISTYDYGQIAALNHVQAWTQQQQFGTVVLNGSYGSNVISATSGNTVSIRPPSGASVDLSIVNAAGTANTLVVNDNGAVATRNNTMDDGNGNSSIRGNTTIGGESSAATYLACYTANGKLGHCTSVPSGTPPTCGCKNP